VEITGHSHANANLPYNRVSKIFGRGILSNLVNIGIVDPDLSNGSQRSEMLVTK